MKRRRLFDILDSVAVSKSENLICDFVDLASTISQPNIFEYRILMNDIQLFYLIHETTSGMSF